MKKSIMGILLLLVASSLAEGQAQTAPATAPVKNAEGSARTAPLKVGEMAPDFTLEDQQGRKITLSAARGKAPVVLVFYRGYW